MSSFLGNFQPEPGKPALWELESDQHSVGNGEGNDEDDERYLSCLEKKDPEAVYLVDERNLKSRLMF